MTKGSPRRRALLFVQLLVDLERAGSGAEEVRESLDQLLPFLSLWIHVSELELDAVRHVGVEDRRIVGMHCTPRKSKTYTHYNSSIDKLHGSVIVR